MLGNAGYSWTPGGGSRPSCYRLANDATETTLESCEVACARNAGSARASPTSEGPGAFRERLKPILDGCVAQGMRRHAIVI